MQDLSWAADVSIPSRSHRPLSTLYDSLVRPDADLGHHHMSCLEWKLANESTSSSTNHHKVSHDPENIKFTRASISHIVLGSGPPGGSWNGYDDEVNTF